MDRKRARHIGDRLGPALAGRFGPRRHYSRSEIERVCGERGFSNIDDVLMATVLFGPDDLAAELAISLDLDFEPGELFAESGETFEAASGAGDLFGDGLE